MRTWPLSGASVVSEFRVLLLFGSRRYLSHSHRVPQAVWASGSSRSHGLPRLGGPAQRIIVAAEARRGFAGVGPVRFLMRCSVHWASDAAIGGPCRMTLEPAPSARDAPRSPVSILLLDDHTGEATDVRGRPFQNSARI